MLLAAAAIAASKLLPAALSHPLISVLSVSSSLAAAAPAVTPHAFAMPCDAVRMSSQAVEASALLSTAGVTYQYYVASIICCGFRVDLLELLDTAIPLIFQQAPIFVQLCASCGHTSFRNSHLELQMSLQQACVLVLLLVLLDVAH
jgi:hypothetical protein